MAPYICSRWGARFGTPASSPECSAGRRCPSPRGWDISRDIQDGCCVGYRLVAGAHRLAAAKYLKWDSISAIVVETDDTEAHRDGTEAAPAKYKGVIRL